MDTQQEALRREKQAELEQQRLELRARTEERRAAAAQQRDERRWQVERADRIADQRHQADREERLAAIQRRYEDQQRRLEMRFELRRSAILKGYGDSSVEELERFVDGLEDYARHEEGEPAAMAASERPALDEVPPVRLAKDLGAADGSEQDEDDLADDVWKYEG